ncbi:hypothetical protein NC797_09785 [Aquibacillus sp. 3ASR75-11]|uniref:ABC transporter periplasmic binding protein yphF n=1 Tax=Terrihalobacillus insolitus TaxID=2950438 RepID=A0A9X3WSS6_9BACI|nr:hypothetical protein [Terrihalobacillus insolitus]MDC3413058.1 hypothetical protein [Terrihalobacillus insolitus]MDC3424800.1 hypothetical protein [Terrihalobacillus insolitus]
MFYQRTYITLLSLLLLLLLLSGCLYPKERLSKNQMPNDAQLSMVQDAVDTYRENTNGLVPIKTKEQDTPIFLKYVIDFTALKEQNLIQSIPGNAFENGGIYQYVLIYPEQNPTVKLIDLRIAEKLRSLQQRVNIYRNKNIYPPFGKEIDDGVYQINYEKLGLDALPYVESPYTQRNLPVVFDTQGNLLIDYSKDLFKYLNEYKHNYKNGDDIRYILADNAPFVPAYSLPYTIKDGEPIPLKNE